MTKKNVFSISLMEDITRILQKDTPSVTDYKPPLKKLSLYINSIKILQI